MSDEKYALLRTFRGLFEGKPYRHRIANLGDLVASHLYEDLVALGKSAKLVERVQHHERVVNLKNLMTGKPGRRGDGTFGELVPAAVAIIEKGMLVARGPVATIEIGAETKILAKAMIKQIDALSATSSIKQHSFGAAEAIPSAWRSSELTLLSSTSRSKDANAGPRTAGNINTRSKRPPKLSSVSTIKRKRRSTNFRYYDSARRTQNHSPSTGLISAGPKWNIPRSQLVSRGNMIGGSHSH
jgi:hypothetical protein